MKSSSIASRSTFRLLAALLSLAAFSEARAGEPDPKAKELLETVAKAYQALPAYADQGEFVLAMTVQGKANKETIPISVAFVRPDKIRIETPLSTLVCDGKTLTTSLKPLKKFTVTAAPKPLNFDTLFTEGPAGSAIFGGPGGPPMLIPLNLLLATDPVKAVSALGQELKTAEDVEIDGRSLQVLRIEPTFQVAIDPETHLLGAVDVVFKGDDLKETLPGSQSFTVESFRWTPKNLDLKPPADSTFVYTPPEGFQKVSELTEELAEAGAGAGAPKKEETFEDWVDKPGPDFTLTLLDGKDSTKTVRKGDLAGKVVLIDFWATWCGPCLQELPQIQELIEHYSKEKKEVVVIALSEDEGNEDLKEVRTLVESTLSEKKLVLRGEGSEVGSIALDPKGKIGNEFKVTGLPSLVILDGKGMIRSVHVGFSPEIGETLRKEIDALLEPAK